MNAQTPAIARVQVMRDAGLKSLRKKVAKLEAMDIEAEVRDVATQALRVC